MTAYRDEYDRLSDQVTARGVDIESVKGALSAQQVETPSWGYGDSGTRFAVFHFPGGPHGTSGRSLRTRRRSIGTRASAPQ
jgi:L-rhamnose isomerase